MRTVPEPIPQLPAVLEKDAGMSLEMERTPPVVICARPARLEDWSWT